MQCPALRWSLHARRDFSTGTSFVLALLYPWIFCTSRGSDMSFGCVWVWPDCVLFLVRCGSLSHGCILGPCSVIKASRTSRSKRPVMSSAGGSAGHLLLALCDLERLFRRRPGKKMRTADSVRVVDSISSHRAHLHFISSSHSPAAGSPVGQQAFVLLFQDFVSLSRQCCWPDSD